MSGFFRAALSIYRRAEAPLTNISAPTCSCLSQRKNSPAVRLSSNSSCCFISWRPTG